MPLKLDDIRSIEIGSISSRKLTDADEQLDSYQEKDLNDLKHQWLNEIEKKKFDIDSKIKEINSKETKSLNDIQREEILVQQTVYLSQEKAIVISPPVASGIPGTIKIVSIRISLHFSFVELRCTIELAAAEFCRTASSDDLFKY